MEEGEEPALSSEVEPSSEVASEASVPPFSNFVELGTDGMAEPHQSVFWMQAIAPRQQLFPAFPDFMEEMRSSWDQPASTPSMSKQASQLASLEGVDMLGLAGFPPVDSTIAALLKTPLVGGLPKDPVCPNPSAGLRRHNSSGRMQWRRRLPTWQTRRVNTVESIISN
ncbi:UNVERIFIED_CONTAM: hypothetical protein FKN15_022173 [Acipenser sinensis]